MFGAGASVKMTPELISQVESKPLAICRSIWQIEHIRKGRVIDKEFVRNIVTTEGLNSFLNIMFKSGTQITSWYIILFENDYTPLAGDSYLTNGWTETTVYDETTRPIWTGGTVAAGSVDNSASKATFTFNASKTIYGGCLVGGGSAPSTKGNTAGGGTAYCGVRFAASKGVVSTDVLKITATLEAADDPS